MATPRQTKSPPDETKFKEAIIYLATLTERDQNCSAVKLNKLLFDADFLAYRRFGKSITGQEYQHLPQGPRPRRMKPVLAELAKQGFIDPVEEPLYEGPYIQKRTDAKRTADLTQFSRLERQLLEEVVSRFWDDNATDISDLSHNFIGWLLTDLNETISYSTVLIGKREPTAGEVKIGQHLRKLAREALSRHSG
jgi:hypothetical protein